jgi:RHS repeat-associated protein
VHNSFPTSGDSITFTRGNKLFELTNHLGNVLATVSDKRYGVSIDDSTVVYYNPELVSANDYYPFGMLQYARSWTEPSVGNYRFGFNGKENDNEVKGVGDQIDYGMRVYDPRIGRFLSTDPFSIHFPYYSAYQYAGDKPVWATDLDGAEEFPLGSLLSTEELELAPLEGIIENSPSRGGTPIPTIPAPSAPNPQPLSNTRVGPGGLIEYQSWTSFDQIPWFIPNLPELKKSDADQTAAPKQSPHPEAEPKPNPQRLADPPQAPTTTKEDDDDEKIFYVTYTKTKVMPDGTVKVYSGRTSGTYTGAVPTRGDADHAVSERDKRHQILNDDEHYGQARTDKYSTEKEAIRGREQQLIDYHGGAQKEGGTSRNKIRAVDRKNKNRRIYEDAANRKFGKLKSNNPADKQLP